MINNIIRDILLLIFALFTLPVTVQSLSTKERQEISKALTRIIDHEMMGGSTKIQRVDLRGRRLRLHCSVGLANYPFREANVAALYNTVRNYRTLLFGFPFE